ncbi:MAG: 3-oxoacyl-ACP reductase FabG [Pseudomonadota bacterium]
MKHALVTGGASPIGAAISRRLAADGHHVIVHANANAQGAQALVAEIAASGGSAESLTLDLTDAPNALASLEAKATDHPIQIVVHNAGLHRDMPFAGMDLDDWTSVLDVNLSGLFVALRPLIMPMMRARWGRVIAVSSLTAVSGNRGQTNYAAAKGGYLAFAKSLTREYASRGITANVVAPGLIATPDTEAMENFEALRKLCPAGRAGSPDDVAGIIGFLASDQSGYISGQMIAVDGGTS